MFYEQAGLCSSVQSCPTVYLYIPADVMWRALHVTIDEESNMNHFSPIAPAAITSNYQILRIKQVSNLIGLSRSTIYELMNPKSKYYDPTFPKSIQLSQESVGWLANEIDNWLISKIAQRNDSATPSFANMLPKSYCMDMYENSA